MRSGTLSLSFLFFVLLSASAAQTRSLPVEVFFSPDGGCTEAVVLSLKAAKKSVYVQAYSFTSSPIAKALVDAHRRNVKVSVVLDDSQRSEKYSSADFLNNAGVIPQIDSRHAIAHNKVMIIDEQTVITGSFNFTKAAEERNAENLLIINDKDIAAKYLRNWQQHAAHAEGYVRTTSGSKTGKGPKLKAPSREESRWSRFFQDLMK